MDLLGQGAGRVAVRRAVPERDAMSIRPVNREESMADPRGQRACRRAKPNGWKVKGAVLVLLLVGNLPAAVASTSPSELTVDTLTVEHQPAPLGIDAASPRLGWLNHSPARGQ